MKIITKNIIELIEYEGNHKIHTEKQIKALAKSIEKYDFNVPIIIDENNVILSGHGRYEAMLYLRKDTVPCIVKENLTEKQKAELRVLDNTIVNLGKYDKDKLKKELELIDDKELNQMVSNDLKLVKIELDNIEMKLETPTPPQQQANSGDDILDELDQIEDNNSNTKRAIMIEVEEYEYEQFQEAYNTAKSKHRNLSSKLYNYLLDLN